MKVAVNSFRNFLGDQIVTNENVYTVLQAWINHSYKNGVSGNSLLHYFAQVKSLLYHNGIKLTREDVKENLNFPHTVEEEKHPLKLEEIHKIFYLAPHEKKSLYLCLLSSGMRPIEALNIRKKDVDLSLKRPAIHIPAKFTKLRRGRTTFISKEAWQYIQPRFIKLEENDTIWSNNLPSSESALFSRYVDLAGLNSRYESTNLRKITLYSLRSYFITKISRFDANLAKKLAGQKGYLLQYDRLTDEEKCDLYYEFEPELLVYDNTKLKLENAKLRSQEVSLESITAEMKSYRKQLEQIASDQKTLWDLVAEGKIDPAVFNSILDRKKTSNDKIT